MIDADMGLDIDEGGTGVHKPVTQPTLAVGMLSARALPVSSPIPAGRLSSLTVSSPAGVSSIPSGSGTESNTVLMSSGRVFSWISPCLSGTLELRLDEDGVSLLVCL